MAVLSHFHRKSIFHTLFCSNISWNWKCREITERTRQTCYKAMFLSRSQNIDWKRRGIPPSAAARFNKKGKRALKTFAGTSRGWRDVHRSFLLLATTTSIIVSVSVRGGAKRQKKEAGMSAHIIVRSWCLLDPDSSSHLYSVQKYVYLLHVSLPFG